MPLNAQDVENAQPGETAYKLFDARGLYLLVAPSGAKFWKFKYKHQGVEKKLALGRYPDLNLAKARLACDAARVKVAGGQDPSGEKRLARLTAKWSRATTFAAVAGELIEKAEREARACATIVKMKWALDLLRRDIGNRPIEDIAVPEILATLQRLERQGKLESAKRVRAFAGRVFRYAIATARAKSDPTTHLKGAIAAPKPKPRAAIVDPERLGELLRAIERYSGAPVTVLALSLLPHVFLRPGELRKAQWREFDFEKKIWTVPAARMKMRRDHKVPLSRQSIFILDQLRPLTGGGQFVFPAQGKAGGTLSENTINAALRRMGFASDEMCGHGFRATASTNMNEAGTWHPDAIERAQARVDANTVRSVYYRAEHWNERVQLAQWWSDKLDEWRGHPTSLMPVRSSVRA